ncbi:hypothetical protein BH10BAC5_BH10BAC5_18520 [soil metagenome]
MKKNLLGKFLLCFLSAMAFAFVLSSNTYAQETDNPTTWKYFRILARAQDDSIFIQLQDELGVSPPAESYTVVVNISDPNPNNQYVVFGDEADPSSLRAAWSQLSKKVQTGLIGWTGTNKENLNAKKLNYASVFIDVFKRIKIKDVIAPPRRDRDIRPTTAYINPYFQAFGGDYVGIPLKQSVGFSFGFGTPYSFPLETDVVGGKFHLLGASVGINGRIKEFAARTSANGSGSSTFNSYNGIYAPNLMLQLSYVIPFGNFFEVGYSTVLDSGLSDVPGPFINTVTGLPMPNNVLKGNYTNFEFRYPFRTFGSTRAKIYAARYYNETHIGFLGREMRLAGSVFDTRIDATLKGVRNFQIAIDIMVSNIGEGFAFSSFAIGPSLRLSKLSDDKIGFLTILVNARMKLGDFFDETGTK